jgi:ferredoxin-NADP reductase
MKLAEEYSEITYIPIVTQDAMWQERSERIDSSLLQQVLTEASQAYVCGSFSFTSQIGDMLEQHIPTSQVHREYFG